MLVLVLNPFRRHLESCKHKGKGRKHRHCNCPIAVEGKLRGKMIRKSLDLRSWEAAVKLIREWEADGPESVTVKGAVERFTANRESMHRRREISEAMLRKYKHVGRELEDVFGSTILRSVTVDEIRKMVDGWDLAPITTQKRLEMTRKFFQFCMDSEWIDRNPAKMVKNPPAKYEPTLPFTDAEME